MICLKLNLILLHVTLQCCAHVLNVTKRCLNDTHVFLKELHSEKPSKYAMLMYDAFGKMGSDVVGGNVNRPGSLPECVSANGPGFNGMFCNVFLRQETVRYFVGICVPDSCKDEEIQELVIYDVFQKDKTSFIPAIPSELLLPSAQAVFTTQCLTRSPSPDFSAVLCLFLCCVLIIIPLGATIYMRVMKWKLERGVRPANDLSLVTTLKRYGSLLSSGSPERDMNASALPEKTETECSEVREDSGENSNTSTGAPSPEHLQDSFSSLNGIRILSLLWIVSGHNTQLSALNIDNFKRWKETAESNPLYIVSFSGPVYLAVDTFLFIGGLLSTKSLLSCIQKANDNLSPGLVAKFLFKRFKRVQPLHIFIVCLVIGLFSVVQKEPFWFIIEGEILNCKKHWWSNLLLMNNLLTITDICAPWTWYLSIDFQFYITTPVLIFIYRLNKYVFLAVSAILLVISSLVSALLTAFLHLPVHQPTTLEYEIYFQYYYNKPYTRYGPYLVGILTGIFLTSKKHNILKNKLQAALGWAFSLCAMALLVGVAYALRTVPDQPSVPHALYQGLHRTVWALAVAWIVLACEYGHGGLIGKILSLKMWAHLSNISFACYLIHPVLIILYNGKQETPVHYTDVNFFYLFLGHVVLTAALGYILSVLIEKPYLFMNTAGYM